MLTDVSAVRNYFAKLGLETEIADIYLALYSYGPQNISELARHSGVERTRIYRLIDALMETSLIEVETQTKRGIIKAAPITNLHILINQREQELKNLQDELGLIEQVLARNSLSSPSTRVQFYQGPQGIRQMHWNELNATSEILGYSNRILEEATGKKYMERWTDEFVKRKLTSRLLVNEDFVQSWTQGRRSIGTGRRVKGIDYRLIAPEQFKLTHLCTIYDAVVSYHHQKDGEVFGVEIYNQDIADSQRQFFELLWGKSQPEIRF
jgi:sugar-specific transcriptional regulator TrmB